MDFGEWDKNFTGLNEVIKDEKPITFTLITEYVKY